MSEMESHEAATNAAAGGRFRWLDPLRAAVRAHPALAAIATLVLLAAASALLRSVQVGWVAGPKVFMDELGYERMAQSFAHTGHFALFGKGGLAYSPLYPIVLSPIYRLTSSAQTAYDWAKVLNGILISLSVFPVYAIARFVLPRGRSVGVAAVSLIAPLMLYASFEMSESLAYPLFLVAIWTMLRAIRRPSAGSDALLLAAIVLACAARLQLVVLIPAAITAILVVALLRPQEASSRAQATRRAVSGHWLLFGTVALGLVAFVARTAMNGGNLPLAGRYSVVGTAHASALRVFELFFQHLAELDFAVAVIPFAAALLAGYALVRAGFPRRPLIYAAVAIASTFWLLVETAYDAAAFDATSAHPRHVTGPIDVPRIHERYLIYLVPLFLVALFAALPLLRSKIAPRRHVAIAVVAGALPLLIPFGSVINNTSAVDSFALQPFARIVHGSLVPIPHPTLLIAILSALMAFGYFRASARPLPSLAVSMTIVALLGLTGLELNRQITPISQRAIGLPAHNGWVDRAVGGSSEVSVVGGARVDPTALDETAFWNNSVTRVYYTCSIAFGAGFGEELLTLDRSSGVLSTPSGQISTRYAVVPAAFHASGRVLARDPAGKLVLVAPRGGELSIPAGSRRLLRCTR
jgi:hypothetical protein